MDDEPPILAYPSNRQVPWDPAQRPPSPLNPAARRFPAPIPPRTCAQEASASPYGASPHSGSPYGAVSSASPVPLRRYNSVTSPAPPPVSVPPAGSSPAPKSPLFRTPSLGTPVRISAAREQPSPPMFLPPTASGSLPIAVPLYIPPNHPPVGPADRSFAPSCAYEPRAQHLDRAFAHDGGCAYEQRVPPRGPAAPLARGNSGAASRRAAPIPRHSSLPLAASAYPSGNYSSAVSNGPCPAPSNNQRHAKGPAGNLVTSGEDSGKYVQAGGWEKPFIHRSTSAPVPDDEAWEEEREYEEGEEEEEGEDWEEEMGENEMAPEGEGRKGEMSGAGGWQVSARAGGPAGGETRGWRGEEPRRQPDRAYLTSPYDQQQQQQQQQSHLARHLSLEPQFADNRCGQTRGDEQRAEGREGRGANLLRQASDGQCLARNGGYGRGGRGDAQDEQDRQYLDRQCPDRQQPDRQQPDRQQPDRQQPNRQQPDRQQPDRQQPDRQQPDRQQPDRQQPDRQQPDRRHLDRRHADGMYVDRSEPDRERLIELRLRRHYQPCTDHANTACNSTTLPSKPACTNHLQRSASDGRAMTGQVAPDRDSTDCDSPDQVVPAQMPVPNLVACGQVAPGQVVPQLLPSRSLRQLRRMPPLDSRTQQQQQQQQPDTRTPRARVAVPEPTQSPSYQTSSPYLPPRPPLQSPPTSPPYTSPCSPPLSPPASTGTAICHSPSHSSPSSSSSFVWPRGNGPDFGAGGRAALGGADKWVACFVPQCWNRN
ncbi:unnamed protein product [Closterium sp. Naga37s-1]|nr:unnamed protein product [Closterium sp. Naga37s-1]